MSSLLSSFAATPNPQTDPTAGLNPETAPGISTPLASPQVPNIVPGTPTPGALDVGSTPGLQTSLPGSMQLGTTLSGLPSTPPLGAYTDAEYLANEAQLRQSIESQYSDLLKQLGYVDPSSGAFIPGSVETNANIQRQQLRRQMDLADQNVTQNAQQTGTLFSGIRGTQQAQAEEPSVQGLAQLEYQTPQTLTDLYNQAAGLINDYHTKNSLLMADAANRALSNIDTAPGGGTTTTTPPPTDTTPPPTPPPADTGGLTYAPGATPDNAGSVYFSGAQPQGIAYASNQTPSARGGIVAMAEGGEIDRPTLTLMGERSQPGNERSHEVVIPRYRLTARQNKQLDKLIDAAGIADAAARRVA